MNELSNFCNGQCPPTNETSTANTLDFSQELPYQIAGENIEQATISMNATHYNDILEFNVHNYFGHLEGYATNQFLEKRAKRKPFIISRSTAVGSGRYINHWGGDNAAT